MNEFRKDLVSGEWVLFSTGRKKRPHQFAAPVQVIAGTCPFDDLSGQELVWTDGEVSVIANKYPAVDAGLCAPSFQVGPFQAHPGTGTHDVFVYKNHDLALAEFSQQQLEHVIASFQRRYAEIAAGDDCTKYILIFHNSGAEAGASLIHPHSQVLSMPILPPDIARSLYGAQRFFQEHQRRVYDVMLEWERQEGKRIVYENDAFIAYCPYASKYPYEVRIFPKESHAHFEKMPEALRPALAQAMRILLRKMNSVLDDPAYNFFIHTAPVDDVLPNTHEFYSWHVEILPKGKVDAGFEFGTGIIINSVDPDDAARELREASID